VLRKLTILFQALADFRVFHSPIPELGFRNLLGFCPFQRHHHSCKTNKLPHLPLPIHRFSQPSNRSHIARITCGFIPHRWHSKGISLQSIPLVAIASNHLANLLLRRYPFFMASFSDQTAFPTLAPQQLTCSLRCLPDFEPLIVLKRPAAILKLDRPWSFTPATEYLVHSTVSPAMCDNNSLGLSAPSGYCSKSPWTCALAFLRLSPLQGSSASLDTASILLRKPLPPWGFCLLTRTPALNPRKTEVIASLRACWDRHRPHYNPL